MFLDGALSGAAGGAFSSLIGTPITNRIMQIGNNLGLGRVGRVFFAGGAGMFVDLLTRIR